MVPKSSLKNLSFNKKLDIIGIDDEELPSTSNLKFSSLNNAIDAMNPLSLFSSGLDVNFEKTQQNKSNTKMKEIQSKKIREKLVQRKKLETQTSKSIKSDFPNIDSFNEFGILSSSTTKSSFSTHTFSSIKKISINDSLLKNKNSSVDFNALKERRDQILSDVFGHEKFRSKKQQDAITNVITSNFLIFIYI